jgi:hypothetical protein
MGYISSKKQLELKKISKKIKCTILYHQTCIIFLKNFTICYIS